MRLNKILLVCMVSIGCAMGSPVHAAQPGSSHTRLPVASRGGLFRSLTSPVRALLRTPQRRAATALMAATLLTGCSFHISVNDAPIPAKAKGPKIEVSSEKTWPLRKLGEWGLVNVHGDPGAQLPADERTAP